MRVEAEAVQRMGRLCACAERGVRVGEAARRRGG